MKIELTISTDTLGEYNTAEDNQRYADAVEDAFNALDSETLDRDRPYLGQPHTFTGERGKQEVFGVTMRDIRDIFFLIALAERAGTKKFRKDLTVKDIYDLDLSDVDPIAISQEAACEIEKLMGIFPNIG